MAGQTVVVSVLADTNPFAKAFKSVGGAVGKLGAGIAAGVAIGGAALAKLGAVAVSAASDLEQSSGGVDAVFKKQAKQVHAWAASAAADLGLSKNAYSEAATIIGSQLKNMGVPMKNVAGESNKLIKKGADLAAQFGGTTADAVSALSSLLRGETDPIERYGISIKQADIAAQMAANGTSKLKGEQAKAAKTAAIMTLLNKQSADAMGANSREAGTWAGVTQRLSAKWMNFKALIGGPMIAVLSVLVGRFSAFFTTVTDSQMFKSGLAWFDGLASSLTKTGGGMSGMVSQAIGLVRSFTPFGLLVKTIQPILPQLGAAFVQVGSTLAGGLAAVLPVLSPLLGSLTEILGQLVVAWLPPLVALVQSVTGVFVALMPPIAALVAQLVAQLAPVLAQLAPVFATLAQVIGVALAAAVPVVTAVLGLFSRVVASLVPILTPLIAVVMSVVQALVPVVSALGELISVLLPPLIALIGGVLDVVVGAASGLISVLAPAVTFIAGVLSGLVTTVARVLAVIIGFATGNKKAQAIVAEAWGKVMSFFQGVPGLIGGWFSSAGKWLLDAGRYVVEGLWKGISDGFGWIKDKISGWVSDVVGFFKDKLGIHSPSRVFRKIGHNIGDGLALGISDTGPRGAAALDKVAALITKTAEKAAKAVRKQAKSTAAAANALIESVSKLQEQAAQMRGQVTDSILSGWSVNQGVVGISASTDFAAMTAEVTLAASQAKSFAGKLTALIKAGLPPQLVQQIAALGWQGGGAVADAFLSASKTDLATYLGQWSQLNQAADSAGKAVSQQMYSLGLAAQLGLISGLESDTDKIRAAAEHLADSLTKAVKKKLGIKSPSTVFRGIAGNVIAGLRQGFSDTAGVKADMFSLARTVETGFDPQLTLSGSPRGATGQTLINITLNGVLDGRSAVRQLRELFNTDARLSALVPVNRVVF